MAPLPLVYQARPAVEEALPPTLAPTAPEAGAIDLPTEAQPSFRLCSPLVDDPLDALPQIISDPYHPPPPGREERHHGVDFAYYNRHERASIEGAGVQAVLSGAVAAALANTFPYGNLIIIETPAGRLPHELAARLGLAAEQSLYILFAHLQSAPVVALDGRVEACQALGSVGRSGNAGGNHLHVETRAGPPGMRFTQMGYYTAKNTPEERENYLLWRTSGTFQHFDPMLLLQP